MVNTSCAVACCGSTSHRNKDLKFHQFPRDERCHLWIQACRRPDLLDKDAEQLKHVHVCGLHFERRMYGRHLLRKSAVPTLRLPHVATAHACTQTAAPIPAPAPPALPAALHITASQGVQTDPTPPPRTRVRGGDSDLGATLENFLELCDVFLPYHLSVVVKSHIAVSPKDY